MLATTSLAANGALRAGRAGLSSPDRRLGGAANTKRAGPLVKLKEDKMNQRMEKLKDDLKNRSKETMRQSMQKALMGSRAAAAAQQDETTEAVGRRLGTADSMAAVLTVADPTWTTAVTASGGTAADPCSSSLIECVDGDILTIDFSDQGLKGSIPAELGTITTLTYLNLMGNELTGDRKSVV